MNRQPPREPGLPKAVISDGETSGNGGRSDDRVDTARIDGKPDDVDQTLSVLQHACDDISLTAHCRDLLQQAAVALEASVVATRAERKRYRALFDAVPDPVSVISWDGIVLDLNIASMVAYQRSREQLVGQPVHVLNPEVAPDHIDPVRAALKHGGTYVVEATNMRADGTRFPVEVHSANFELDGQGCIVAVARDLSGREEVELRYRDLLERVDKGMIVRNAQGRITYANASAMRMAMAEEGFTMDEELRPGRWIIFDEHGKELATEELPSSITLATGKAIASTVLGYYNVRLRRLTWVSVNTVPQFASGSDKPDQVVSMFSDVTTLKRNSHLFGRVQDLAHIGGWEWDAGRDILHLTHAAQRALGLETPPSTMVQLRANLVDREQHRFRDALDRALEHGEGFELELESIASDGQSAWLRIIGEAETDDPIGLRLAGTLQDITRYKREEKALRDQARTDPLTGLLNRDAVLRALDERLHDPALDQLAVLYIDLDRFKFVNDVLGHASGDRVLCSAAKRLQRAIGTQGIIARFGGDEFMVVCNTRDDAGRPERLADAILEAFSTRFHTGGEEFDITASIGIARAPGDGTQPQKLIQNADVAMYNSKRRARNGRQAFTPELAEQQLQRLQLETQLRQAIESHEFHLVYQPQIDLASGRIVSAEALIRWNNPVLGQVPPDKFIAVAEATGDIVAIGRWVLREACAQLRRWRDQGLSLQRIAINVSYRQFHGEELAANVRDALHESGLSGDSLELEFTERVLIEDADDALQIFADLRALGVMLAIDDFGEGFSALNYLRRLPVHGLKLSHSFLQGVPDNASDTAICKAVVGIARSLHLNLVAEGVESDAQREFLLKLGVPVGQGFLFDEGLQADVFAQRLHDDALQAP